MRKVLILCLLLALIVIGTAAQDDELMLYEGAFSFSYPADWEPTEKSANLVELTTEDGATIRVFGPGYMATPRVMASSDLPADLLTMVLQLNDIQTAVRAIALDDETTVVGMEMPLETETILAFMVMLEDESVGAVIAWADRAVLDAGLRDQVLALTESYGSLIPTDEVAELAAPLPPAPCFISTDTADRIRVRVGPGVNRSVIAFLPVDTDFEVFGRALDLNNQTWYQINAEEAAPDKLINEAWVAALDVDARGECSKVVDVDAPPIVPLEIEGGVTEEVAAPSDTPYGLVFVSITNKTACTLAGGFRGRDELPTYDFSVPVGETVTLFAEPGFYDYSAAGSCGTSVQSVIQLVLNDPIYLNFVTAADD